MKKIILLVMVCLIAYSCKKTETDVGCDDSVIILTIITPLNSDLTVCTSCHFIQGVTDTIKNIHQEKIGIIITTGIYTTPIRFQLKIGSTMSKDTILLAGVSKKFYKKTGCDLTVYTQNP
jgi:hypothetical protein